MQFVIIYTIKWNQGRCQMLLRLGFYRSVKTDLTLQQDLLKCPNNNTSIQLELSSVKIPNAV